MPKLVWLNGNVMPLESATTSVADHAHLYGDGLFEGIRFYNRRIFKFDEHLERLYHGMAFLGFQMHIPYAELREIVLDVCKQSDLPDGYIRLNVTRGTGLGLDPKKIEERPNVMVMVSSLNLYPPELFEVGLTIVLSPIRTIPADSLDPRLKCIGRYASNILAKQLANKAGAGDALMLNHQGYVAEGTGNNFFLVQNKVIRTPHPSCGILQGITRDAVIEMARGAGYTVKEENLTVFDVYAADEAFFTGTATEVIPAVMIDGTKIGCGKPGEVTQELMGLFKKAILNGTPF
ncbi:MAG: branched-chain-amino-acid transaminase [Fimbriimonadales bacterium]